jgi:hypothetical protein
MDHGEHQMKLTTVRPFLLSACFLLAVALIASILSGCASYRADFRYKRTQQTAYTIERVTEKLEAVKARHTKQGELFELNKAQEKLRKAHRAAK